MSATTEMNPAADLDFGLGAFEPQNVNGASGEAVKNEAAQAIAQAAISANSVAANVSTSIVGTSEGGVVGGNEASGAGADGEGDDQESDKEKAERLKSSVELAELAKKKAEAIKKIEDQFAAKEFALKRKEVSLSKRRGIAFDLVERMRETVRTQMNSPYMTDADADGVIEEKFKNGMGV